LAVFRGELGKGVQLYSTFSATCQHLVHKKAPVFSKIGALNFSGGDGGELNSPSKRSCPGYTTGLVSSLISPDSPLLTELKPSQSINLSHTLTDVGVAAPQLFDTRPPPIEARWGGRTA
jgi:hypothetical protein